MNAAVDGLFASPAFVKHVRAASGAFIFITSYPYIGIEAVDKAATRILNAMDDPEADFVWSANFEKTETDRVCITLIVVAGD